MVDGPRLGRGSVVVFGKFFIFCMGIMGLVFFLYCMGMGERICENYFRFIFFSGLSPKFLPICFAPSLFVRVTIYLYMKKIFDLNAKQIKINYWISRINHNFSFNILETKQRKMDS